MSRVRALAAWLEADVLQPLVVELPSGRVVEVVRLLRQEVRASEPIDRVPGCWAPNKPALSFEGKRTWAELSIVRLLEREGWAGRWIKNWTGGREVCIDVGVAQPMPPSAADVFARIDARAASRTGGGAWDVFAWREDEYLCIESKQHRSSDRLRPGQIAWFDAALAEGLEPNSFAIVEYDAGPPAPAGARARR